MHVYSRIWEEAVIFKAVNYMQRQIPPQSSRMASYFTNTRTGYLQSTSQVPYHSGKFLGNYLGQSLVYSITVWKIWIAEKDEAQHTWINIKKSDIRIGIQLPLGSRTLSASNIAEQYVILEQSMAAPTQQERMHLDHSLIRC